MRWLGRWRLFRYEVRCWPGGVIPDQLEAVGSPVLLSADAAVAQHILQTAGQVPVLVWGRDECGTGDMWNSNSVTSWLIERSGLDAARIALPAHGRAPGWQAGIDVARQSGTLCPAPVVPAA